MNKLIIGNLKMNLLSALERDRYFNNFKQEAAGKRIKNAKIVICPPAVHLEAFQELKRKNVFLGAQNIFWERSGSFTGEVSPGMVKNLGADFVILGHSERRRYFCENNQEINLKIGAALKNGLKPILCVGENEEQKENGILAIVEQLDGCLRKISRVKIEDIIICYEPVWAISSNNPDHLPTTNEIMSARLLIKKFLVEKYGVKIAEKTNIIYGGSVDAKNVGEVCLDPGIDGVLVGKESLTPYEFIKIAKIIDQN